MNTPNYKTHDPLGWGGNPARGAAVGRSSIVDGIEPATFDGRLVLRRVHLNSGGYDRNGTYFGYDLPLYWYAFDDGERTLDCMLRASNRADAKAQILKKYPLARFYR